jgi:PhzF family phenazine biosynthesis protein
MAAGTGLLFLRKKTSLTDRSLRNIRERKIQGMQIPVFHVDAFTDSLFTGNPAAVCLLDFWLDDASLRKVAAENNLPATAFLVPSNEGYELRWFSSVCELKLCGHATLAAAFVLFRFLRPGLERICFSTRFRGALTVFKAGKLFSMEFPALAAKSCALFPELQTALRPTLKESDIQEVFEGHQTYAIFLESQAKVQNFQPNFVALGKLHPQTLVITAPGNEVDFVSRYFAAAYGIPEDFVTGSSHCLLTPIWAKRLGRTTLRARQLSARPGELTCELKGDRVVLQGHAVAVMRGSLTI